MNITFRTNAGREYGWGNIIRLYNFYVYLIKEKPNYNYRFFVQGDNEVFNFLKKKKIRFIKLKDQLSIDEELRVLKKNKENDILICEMLDLSYERQTMYKRIYKKVIVFDDLINQKYNANFVICAQEWPSYQNIKISNNNTQFLLGYDYFIFSKFYENYRKKRLTKKISKKINSIVIVLGGGDYDLAYMNTALAIKKMNLNIKITFILGFASISKKTKIIKKILPNATIKSNIANISKYLYNSDLAIVGGGYTKVESAFLLTPCIIISVQWHQIPLADYFAKITNSPHLGYYKLFDDKIMIENIRKLSSFKKRKKISQKYLKLFKNNSPNYLIEKIFNV